MYSCVNLRRKDRLHLIEVQSCCPLCFLRRNVAFCSSTYLLTSNTSGAAFTKCLIIYCCLLCNTRKIQNICLNFQSAQRYFVEQIRASSAFIVSTCVKKCFLSPHVLLSFNLKSSDSYYYSARHLICSTFECLLYVCSILNDLQMFGRLKHLLKQDFLKYFISPNAMKTMSKARKLDFCFPDVYNPSGKPGTQT